MNLEPSDNNVFMLLDFNDVVCPTVDLSNTFPFPCRDAQSMPSKYGVDINESPYDIICKNWALPTYLRNAHFCILCLQHGV